MQERSANYFAAFLACRLIGLDKQLGVRPVGIGEVLRGVIGKVVIKLLRKDILKATGSLQLCTGQDAGSEAAICAVYDMFNEDDTEAVLMIHTSNAFNSINREAFLHSTKVLSPALATFISNCYSVPSDVFVQGGKRLKSFEGTRQGDPAALAIYALGITPLLTWLNNLSKEKTEKFQSRQVAFADDLDGVDSLENLKKCWELLEEKGVEFAYHVKASKSHIIVKEKYQGKAKQIFQGSKITITT